MLQPMNFIASVVMMFAVALTVSAQTSEPILLWPDGAPGARGDQPQDKPTLTPYLARTNNGPMPAIVICPGGGYGHLADHEGRGYALWLNDHGVSAFVLKYRLGSSGYRHPVMLQDAARAVRLVRARATDWNIDPQKVGIMGSSAGGHLASTLLTHFDSGDAAAVDPVDQKSSRPDLGILCYPVITLGTFTHRGSRNQLLGTNAPADLVELLSNEKQVTPQTPPTFLWHTFEDKAVPVENSLQFADALRKAGVPFDLHVYQKGGHGLGLGMREYKSADAAKLLPWTADCLYWLRQQGWIP
jgi:acetyl esterase/lipase